VTGRVWLYAASLIVCCCVLGCAKTPVAVVNGKTIDAESFDLAMRETVGEHARQKAGVDRQRLRQAVIFQLVTDRLMIDDAANKGIKVSDKEVTEEIGSTRKRMGEEAFHKMLGERDMSEGAYRKRTKERMIIARFREGLEKGSPVTEEEVRNYYRNSQKPFIRPARMLAKMIEMESGDTARAALKEMRRNKITFDDMAAKLAAEGKAVVIDYGWVKADFFSPEIARGLMNLMPGRYGGPYMGRKKIYLIKVKEREKERIAAFEEVREDIRKVLTEQRQEEAFARWLDGKRKTATVEVSIK
jgi:parvulin-like peptidyl-prolyl isomerase